MGAGADAGPGAEPGRITPVEAGDPGAGVTLIALRCLMARVLCWAVAGGLGVGRCGAMNGIAPVAFTVEGEAGVWGGA